MPWDCHGYVAPRLRVLCTNVNKVQLQNADQAVRGLGWDMERDRTLKQPLAVRIRAGFERMFPEQRLFLRSETETRFIRLTPMTQFIGMAGCALLVGWTIISSSILLMHGLGAGDLREQALRDQAIYEGRLNTLAAERDARAKEASDAQDRFSVALAEVSAMQLSLIHI